GYLAPERIRGGPPTPKSDLYALGAVLHHVVFGEPPRAAAPRVVPDSSVLDASIFALLRADPRERPPLDELELSLTPSLASKLPIQTTMDGRALDRDPIVA